MRPRAVALIDGEHYPSVVLAALQELKTSYDFQAAVFLGGTEKIRRGDLGEEAEEEARRLYGLPVLIGDPVQALERALDVYRPAVVVDVSDEPVVTYQSRFRLISHVLARSVSYQGADFRFTPPNLDRLCSTPSISIIGTAKRVGKTAVSGYVARTMQGHAPLPPHGSPGVVVVAMGRGGPDRPEVIDGRSGELGPKELLVLSREGRHAASDHFEDAVLSRVLTVGCRRCGGGMAGQPFVSNVAEGASVANSLGPSLTIFEGSGAAMPPVHTDARLLVAGAHQPLSYLSGYLGTYRVLVSDAVVLTMAEEPFATSQSIRTAMDEIGSIKEEVRVIPIVFRPSPQQPVAGQRAAFFSTAAPDQESLVRHHLEDRADCRLVFFSPNLSDRRALETDLSRAVEAGAEVFLTEIKAAAIDLVVETADRLGMPVVLVDNVPQEVGPASDGDLDELCRELAELACARHERGE